MKRPVLAAAALTIGLAVPLACGSDSGSTSATTASNGGPTTSASVGNVLPPVVLSATQTSATVKVGTVVTFDMGDPGEGSFVAVSDKPAVFRVDSEGTTEGTYTTNAGGTALSAGTAEVAVTFRGSMNGMGAPTTFTITVE